MISMILKFLMIYTCFQVLKLNYIFILSKLWNYKFWRKIKGKKAIITGASDGIGKELAIQLSKSLDVILIGRNKEKLEDVKKLCKGNPEIYIYDFSKECDFNMFSEFKDIGLLINNVGVSSDHPCYLTEENRIEEIIMVNCLNTVKITKSILKNMTKNRFGYVVNVCSMLGDIPAPLISVYGSSKSFLKSFSEALYYEMQVFNVHVQSMDTAFVKTKMTRIRKSSFFVPSPETYAYSILKSLGCQSFCVPYYPHLIQYTLLNLIPRWIIGNCLLFISNTVRIKALKKKNKE